jgi:hypothetical protein
MQTKRHDDNRVLDALRGAGWLPLAAKSFGGMRNLYAGVVPMGANLRIIFGSLDDMSYYERYWCYQRQTTAIIALFDWTDPESEPGNWIKADDGRRHGEPLTTEKRNA